MMSKCKIINVLHVKKSWLNVFERRCTYYIILVAL